VPVRTWDLALPFDRDAEAPVSAQIARAISSHIRAGRLQGGERLPGTRDLARVLAVHRNTAAAAYRELAAEGWIVASPSNGTFVSFEIPFALLSSQPRASAPAVRRAGYSFTPLPETPQSCRRSPGSLELVGPALARAYRKAIRRPDVLDYAGPLGEERLRKAIGSMLRSTRGLDPDPASLIVTRGSQHALALIARMLVRPGEVVAVEELGYPLGWEAFRAAGARLVAVPLDADGIRIDGLRALVRREKIRAVYLTPQHQLPTTGTLLATKRAALLSLAASERFAVVEDDYDGDFHYEGHPALPLASNDPAGVVIYVGTFSKILAPALRIGYVHAPREVVKCLADHRLFLDVQGDRALELAVAELLEDGEIQQHVWRMRRIYAARRDALADALRKQLAGVLEFTLPAGGLALWCRAAEGIDVDQWAAEAQERCAVFAPASDFSFDGLPRRALRMTFARLQESDLREAVLRIAAAVPAARRSETLRRVR